MGVVSRPILVSKFAWMVEHGKNRDELGHEDRLVVLLALARIRPKSPRPHLEQIGV